ncbi:BTAD domain-containing putative transcriptional regulator [Nocardiopsis rhodophaea]|uniref:AfsR/SARP family transcriptional regulator n=1 Tax=Nocardiopsis rhodophaea TaxID=280238 RepID=UPI0031D1425B
MTQTTEFLVLGSLEVRRSGELIRLRGMRQQRLLALLLLNANRVVPVDYLVDELWEVPPPSARPQVHNAVRDLRRVLPAADESCLATADIGYRLTVPQDAVDAYRFGRRVRAAATAEREGRSTEAVRLLQSAVDLWRGDAFAGIQCPAAAGAAVKLNEQRLTAIEDLMALRLKLGESRSLIGELHALIAEYPLRDSLRCSLMTALWRSGRQADALAVYDEGRRRLAEELGLDPSPQLKSVHASILAGSPDERGAGGADSAADPDADGAPARPAPTPDDPPSPAAPAAGDHGNYLPADLTDFTARSVDLRTVLSAAGPGRTGGSPLVVAIDGMGGVGKTTLAVHVAHRVRRRYPDGQYFIDLHGFSPTHRPVVPEQALGTLLRTSGLGPDAIPEGLEERSALWRSRLAGRRCLVVLDDAADSAQVRPLLPGAGGALALVTSRRKLTALDGALPVCLDVLPHEDAVALFTRVVGERRATREPAQVATAVELCGYLPLAIRIAATRLRDRPAWAVADLTARLANTERRTRCLRTAERDVISSLRMSYQYLSPSQRRFSRLLSLDPSASFGIETAAAITGLPAADVEGYLDVLLDNNLVRQHAPDHFSFHTLVHDCTREVLTEDADAEFAAEAALIEKWRLSPRPSPSVGDPHPCGSSLIPDAG